MLESLNQSRSITLVSPSAFIATALMFEIEKGKPPVSVGKL